MNKIALEIKGLMFSNSQTGAYVLILSDRNSQRSLPIVIGGNEAQAIAAGIENIKGSRPMTHDLFNKFAYTFQIAIKEVIISRFHEGVFFATIVCEQHGELTMLDARPSDAIALAVRCGCDISAYDSVMEEAGVIMDEKDMMEEGNDDDFDDDAPAAPEEMKENDLATLEVMLQKAIEMEDYEKAAILRDEIQRIKGEQE
ncbi:MAG: bifunctional nuclease domain-containing protein [Candidatus Limimorpha sp.]